MEEIKRKEWRDKDWVCRIGLQIKSCRECLFDNFCSFEDRKNTLHTNQDKNESKDKDRGSSWRKD